MPARLMNEPSTIRSCRVPCSIPVPSPRGISPAPSSAHTSPLLLLLLRVHELAQCSTVQWRTAAGSRFACLLAGCRRHFVLDHFLAWRLLLGLASASVHSVRHWNWRRVPRQQRIRL